MNQAKTNYNIPTNRLNVIQLTYSGAYYTINNHRRIHLFLIRNHTEFPVKFGVSELEHEWGGRMDFGELCWKTEESDES